MGVHHPYHLDLCADDEDPSQLIIRPGWDAPNVRCFPRTLCAWPCLLRQVGTVLSSPYDYVLTRLAYANPGSRQVHTWKLGGCPHVRGSVTPTSSSRKSLIRERRRLLDWESTPRGPPGFVRC